MLEKAADACVRALEIRRKENGPLLWAATQNNLGSALFLLGKMTHNEAQLEGAADAFDQALGVYQEFNATRMANVAQKNLSKVRALMEEIHGPVDASGEKSIPILEWEENAPDF